ncbi:MAG TPA: cyclic nucleotide-binding domain-containing protein [Nocardioides sp.]|nr:cyclic nucleotide-binding domain-containing protein [Nocardioides sp.]
MSSFDELFDYPGGAPTDAGVATGPVFGGDWTAETWVQVLAFSDQRRLRPRERLIRAGDVDRSVFILQEGLLEAVVRTHGGTRRFPMEPGAVIGEVAFFDGEERSADVVAVDPSLVRRFSEESLERLSARHPDLGRAFVFGLGTLLAFRLRRAEANGQGQRR